MDNNKKPSEPVEEERWALKDVPTSQLVEELVNRTGVTAESSWWCRMSSYHIIIRINLNKEDADGDGDRPAGQEGGMIYGKDPVPHHAG